MVWSKRKGMILVEKKKDETKPRNWSVRTLIRELAKFVERDGTITADTRVASLVDKLQTALAVEEVGEGVQALFGLTDSSDIYLDEVKGDGTEVKGDGTEK